MIIKQFKPYLGIQEYEAIKDCFDSNWITEGPKSQEFNKALCDFLGCKYGVFASNGTLSLYIALRSLDIGPGDEVLVPNFTFIASANAVEMTGAKPIFVDIHTDTLHINIEECKKALTPRTKAIMPVHIYGTAAKMNEIMDFAAANSLKVIEDAAQAIGVTWNGRQCGTFGDVGSFSFFADKTITTGEGGFVCTDNPEIYENLLHLRNQGRKNRGSFIHPRIGYNFRITDIQAAIGLVQLTKVKQIKEKKLNILNSYLEHLKDVEEVKFFRPLERSNHIPFRVCIFTKDKSENLMSFLKEKGIETRSFFFPLNEQPCYKQSGGFKNSLYAYEHGVCLPSYPELTEKEIKYISETIKEFYGRV